MISLGIDIGGTSIKAALVSTGAGRELQPQWTAVSTRYARPTAGELTETLRRLLAELPSHLVSSGAGDLSSGPKRSIPIGLCAPGLFDQATRTITRAINMPALVGVNLDELVSAALSETVAPHGQIVVSTDARAAAHDFQSSYPEPGRLLALSLGTGVGACILDNGAPFIVVGNSPGHLGQIDVTIDAAAFPPPIGPDGGRGGLEAYIGLPALLARHGDVQQWLASLKGDEVELQALARAIRIAHAIYRPNTIALLGGVGMAMPIEPLKAIIGDQLTTLAREKWRLVKGNHHFHAAAGAARIAALSTCSASRTRRATATNPSPPNTPH